MQKDNPITDNTLSSEGVLGDEYKLLILHKAYMDLTEDEDDKEVKEEEE